MRQDAAYAVNVHRGLTLAFAFNFFAISAFFRG
jgi:hypothetical protein